MCYGKMINKKVQIQFLKNEFYEFFAKFSSAKFNTKFRNKYLKHLDPETHKEKRNISIIYVLREDDNKKIVS